jgi:hypothetical protein
VPKTVPTVVPTTVPTTNTSLEVLPGSGGIAVPLGSGAAVVDGKVVELIVTVAQDGSGAIELPGEFVLRIIPRDADGSVVPPSESNAIRAYQGRIVEIGGEGFAPNTEVEVWVNSEPVLLGTATTDQDGSFSKVFDLPVGLAPGLHTLTLGGTTKNGQVVKASVALIVEQTPSVAAISDSTNSVATTSDAVPFDPQSEPKGVVDLVANLVALLALASLGGAASGNAGRREDEETDNDRGSGDVSDVSVKYHKTDIDGKDALRMPRISIVDRVMLRAPSMFAHRSPLMSRVLTDGTYLRSGFGALWLVLPLFGIVLGFMSAQNTDYAVRMPSLMLLTAVVVLGTLDAFSGYLASVVFALAVLVGGGMDSADSIRGVVGIWVFSFGVPLLATATRPFRRTASGVVGIWERCADVVLIALFGAWAAGAMFSSLPGLIGFRPDYASRVSHIQIVVLVALVSRYILENIVAVLAPSRLKEFSVDSLPDASKIQVVISSFLRTAAYIFVASVFIGNNWALWVGGAIYLIPKLVALVDDALPNFSIIHRYMPRGILKVVLMLFVARWWGDVLGSRVTDPEQMIKLGFVLLGVPGIVLTVLGWFARSSRPWPSTWFTRISGMIILIVGILVVFGVLP